MKRSVITIISLFIMGSIAVSAGAATITAPLAWPSATTALIQPLGFGYVFPRANPRHYRNLLYWVNAGIYIAALADSEVYAAENGIIQAIIPPDPLVVPMGSIIIEHTDASGSYTTSYFGVDALASFKVGDPVSRGVPFATVQNQGTATNLQFGVRNAPFGDGVVAGVWCLPNRTAYALPAYPENFIDPLSVLP
jgi:murein DD-endopeptidase MepM/ murein hydrolase activator NlpD